LDNSSPNLNDFTKNLANLRICAASPVNQPSPVFLYHTFRSIHHHRTRSCTHSREHARPTRALSFLRDWPSFPL